MGRASACVFPAIVAGSWACATVETSPVSWDETGLQEAQEQGPPDHRSQIDRSTDALLAAIESDTGELPVFDGAHFDLRQIPDTASAGSSRPHGWITERRALALDVLQDSDRSRAGRASLRRARAALKWDVALDADWSDVDARLVRQALEHADGELGDAPRLPTADWVPQPTELMTWPISPVKITSRFGVREDPFGEGIRRHTGVDLFGLPGQAVGAAADGVVVYAGRRGAYGLHVEVRHRTGVVTRYAHLSAAVVSVGNRVRAGDLIGRVGQSGRATGPHLHFEVWREGLPVDPMDALPDIPPAWNRPLVLGAVGGK
jgi:murein DD-endopeptidase MepM/ murein hydrolase activator NlpD